MPQPDDNNGYNDSDRDRQREDREETRASSRRLDIQVAVLEQRLRQAVIEINALRKDIQELHEDLDKVIGLTNRYRGGLVVVLAVGGLMGWLATILQGALSHFK